MPRRNNREAYEPVDLTPPNKTKPDPIGWGHMSRAEVNHAVRMRDLEAAAERIRRQVEAEAQGGIDWSICLVPGCPKTVGGLLGNARHRPPDRDTSRHLPLCHEHGVVAWRQIQQASGLPVLIETAKQVEKREREYQARLRNGKPESDGELYFVRINDLVKVGWTATLSRRLKEYGAGAELLCHYPGTRDDETTLHRRLNAVRAMGREWYHDGPVIQRYVDQALEEHGPPTAKAAWTVPKNPVTLRQA